ncbi:MAG TPA: two-component regulator propeller domain-containing protein [Puia sp.]|nr:two-component regulator propeller domain-containing protein [Puia sp.]
MLKVTPNCFLPFMTVVALIALASCNNNATDTPFPVSDTGYSQPTVTPLQFSGEKKFSLATVKTGEVKPSVRSLDISKLPSEPYDHSLKKPFSKKPEDKTFDFNALPEKTLDINKITSKKFQFKVALLPPPVLSKAGILSPKSGSELSISDISKLPGFSDKFVFSLMKDKNGVVWIGTNKSLFRYDGEYLKKYIFNNNGAATIDMMEDNEGRLWCINRRGIRVIDLKTNIVRYTDEINAPFLNVPRMKRDANGNIWVPQTNKNGAVIIDPKTESYKLLDTQSGLCDDLVYDVFQDTKKNIWLSTGGGMNIFNPSTGKISYLKKANGLNSDNLESITEDRNGSIWVAEHEGGVECINIENKTIRNFGEAQGLKNKFTFSLSFNDKGVLWIATDHGLMLMDAAKSFTKYFPKEDGLSEDAILSFLFDDKGRAWVGTYQAGLLVIDQNAEIVFPIGKKGMSTLLEGRDGKIWYGTSNDGIAIVDEEKNTIRYLRKEQGLSDNAMQAFLEDGNGNIFITSGGGLDIYDPNRKTISHIGKKEGFVSDTIYSILKDHKSNFWFTGPTEGIDVLDSAQKIIKHAGKENGLNDDNIQDVKEDPQGLIWLVTGGAGGVDIIDPSNRTVRYLNNLPGLKDTCFRLMMLDGKGRMWIGTDKGIYIVDIKQKNVTTITMKQGLPNDYVVSLNEHNGTVIANTKNKIAVINEPKNANEKWSIALLAKSEGLVKAAVTWNSDLITKKGQFLWGDNGVTIIDSIQEQHDSSAPTYVTGLTVMSQPQYFSNISNIVDTLSVKDSSLIKSDNYLASGYSDQNKFHWDSLSGSYNMPVNLHLPFNQNYLQFQFAQQHLGRQDTTFYCYILEGIDKKWSALTSNTYSENYLNLPPGNYSFKVRSKDISGRWGAPATFSFTITPPWWKTWWAYTLLAIICAGILRAYIAYRSKMLKKENKILEEKVEHRTNQLKKSLEELKSTQTQLIQSEKMASLGELTAGIAHEIQNPLNFVNNFSDLSIELAGELKETLNSTEIDTSKKQELESVIDDLVQNQQKINFHGKRADAIVKGMLQHSRSSSGTKEPTDINNLCDEYFRLSYHGLRAKDKSFNAKMVTDFDPHVEKLNVVSQDLGRVILNLITNAFYAVSEKKKMNMAGYDPTVWVATKKLNGKTEIRVKDNGTGIPQKALDKIFQPFFTTKPVGQGTGLGLSLSYDIIKAHGGDLKVETKEGEGAEFIIELPS